jgi:hypothetical protein
MTEQADKTYNGWTNYETWNVKLWMDNERSSYEHYREMAREALANPIENKYIESARDRSAIALADALKDEYEEASQELLERSKATASVWADLLGAALSEVNWREIANSLLDAEDE